MYSFLTVFQMICLFMLRFYNNNLTKGMASYE